VRWTDIAQVWLGGDHYKWRQMRSNGVDERYCTGDAPWHDKFVKFAETMERLVKNPLFDWSHLELSRYFGVNERLCGASAERIWKKCNAKLKQKGFSARGLMGKSNVAVVCTTDDPVDSLEHHLAIAKEPFGTRILPAWRSDKASKIDNLPAWNAWMDKLAAAAKTSVKTYEDFLGAMAKRHAFFAKAGCVISDYGITEVFAAPYTDAEVARIFRKARAGRAVTAEEALKFRSAWLYEGLKADAAANWTAQLHYNCLRGVNRKMNALLGPDTGFDMINTATCGGEIAALLSALNDTDECPKTIIYSLNPADNEQIGTILGCFQTSEIPGKIQHGSAWWFNDQKICMENQIKSLANLGLLGNFVGMLTDSRSFLSYTRHDYFRRILCNLIGQWVEDGEYPNDEKALEKIVRGICFDNAKRYFAL